MRGPRYLDIAGQKFGRATALEFMGVNSGRSAMWRFRCDCGEVFEALARDLRSGRVQSCGCFRLERVAAANKKRLTTHGASFTRTHNIWRGMLARCRNPNRDKFKYYGGRGVKVCERWQGPQGFANFLADMGEAPDGLTLDRHPNADGDYEPGNCRWATWSEQRKNQRKAA